MNTQTIDHSFEAEKNKKALLYTTIICGFLVILFIFYTWPMTIPPPPNVQDLIEINLGNEQEGLGAVQPLIPGDKAPDAQSVTGVHSTVKAHETPSRQIQSDDEGEKDAAPVFKDKEPKKTAKDLNKKSTAPTSKNVNPSPIVNPNPTPPKPKNVYKGGTGPGGNNAEKDNGNRNQGYKPGNGDAGSPDGKPDSYGNSPGGRRGVSVVRGLSGRKPTRFPNMKDDFNEKANVYVDIWVNADGKVTAASITRPTTTTNSKLRNIALTKARELKFPKSKTSLESGTILFHFKLHN